MPTQCQGTQIIMKVSMEHQELAMTVFTTKVSSKVCKTKSLPTRYYMSLTLEYIYLQQRKIKKTIENSNERLIDPFPALWTTMDSIPQHGSDVVSYQ